MNCLNCKYNDLTCDGQCNNMEKITNFLNAVINVLRSLAEFLDGYKTYILGLVVIIEGIIRGDMTTILMGLSVITGRQAIDKVGRAVGAK